MANTVLLMVRGATSLCLNSMNHSFGLSHKSFGSFSKLQFANFSMAHLGCTSDSKNLYALQPPDIPRLAETARISLTPNEIEEFEPKIREVIDWFGQLQYVDLQSVEPSIRADNGDSNLRDDVPVVFDKRDAMIASIPSYEEPYIKVPKVLNKD